MSRFLLVGLVALLAACGPAAPPPSERRTPEATPEAQALPPAGEATAACAPPEHPPLQEGGHLLGDATPPVPYSSTPPTSGWHASGPVEVRMYDEPVTDPEHVRILEQDAAMVRYGQLAAADLEALRTAIDGGLDGSVGAAPHPELAADVIVFTAWGVLQRCERWDAAALERFVTEHAQPVTEGH